MRLFAAICFSDKTREQLFSAVQALRKQGHGQFSSAENLHLTLAFLGETEDTTAAINALSKVQSQAFSLRFDGIGQFGNLYWAGICENDSLRTLQSQLMHHLQAAGFVFEEREFVPHITLARHYKPGENFSHASIEQNLSCIEEPVLEIALMRTLPCGNGVRYQTLAVQPLLQK